jgi:hypothetical protein
MGLSAEIANEIDYTKLLAQMEKTPPQPAGNG